jgi:uncharacterized membrane protein YqiK
MTDYTKPRLWIGISVFIVAVVMVQQFWHWEVERAEVQPGEYLIVTNYWGQNLAENEIVAPGSSYKGVMLEPLPEGRHFINPLFSTYERHKLVTVPSDECLVLTRLYGEPIPLEQLQRGEILAGDGQRGVVREVFRPGSYRLNPHAYSWKAVKAVVIRLDQVGVRTLKVGKDPRELKGEPGHGRYVVPEGYRGVQEKVVGSGTHYINPYVEAIIPVDLRSHRVELSDIEFPSRDGFILKPQVLVEYRLLESKAPETLVRLSEHENHLNQEDETLEQQQKNEILQKVLLPHIRGFARITGSSFDARDFILTTAVGAQKAVNTREELQKRLLEKVRPRCLELGVEVRAVTVADMKPPVDLADQIAQRDLARVEQERNRVKIEQLKQTQKLKATQALKTQNTEKVKAQTRLIQAKTQAQLTKQREELRLKQQLESAQLRLDAAQLEAQAVITNGKADAGIVNAKNEAEVAGLRKSVQGFTSAANFAQYQMISRLAPSLTEIFASDESDFAKIFSAYMTPSARAEPVRPLASATPSPTAGGKR